MKRLSPHDLERSLEDLPRWKIDGESIAAAIECSSFSSALALVVRIGLAAHAADHHPHIGLDHATVTLRLSTRDAGGVTHLDIDLAKEIDRLGE